MIESDADHVASNGGRIADERNRARSPKPRPPKPRALWVDVARGGAILAMVGYHGAFDLVLFGHVDWAVGRDPVWRAFAASIASTFLFLAGVSLALAHRSGIAWMAFARRLAVLGAAAALVSIATTLAMPSGPVYFGILHAIAAFSLLGLPFVFASQFLTIASAFAVALVPHLIHTVPLPLALTYPLGLAANMPPTFDYEPFFPWFSATLLGISCGRRLHPARQTGHASPALALLATLGRNSLVIYLVHQPVLFAILWLVAQTSAWT